MLTGERHVLNNFRLREDIGLMSRRPYIEIGFSAVNRGADPLFLSVQFIGLGGELGHDPVIALSAEPLFGMVNAQVTEQVTASVNTDPGELANIDNFCLRVDA